MYVGFLAGWAGLWVVFGHASVAVIAAALAVLLGVVLFVRLYEEPTLRKKFGAEYEEYCRNVPRWLPHLRRGTSEATCLAAPRSIARWHINEGHEGSRGRS